MQYSEGYSTLPSPGTLNVYAFDSTVHGQLEITRSGQTLSAWIDRGDGPVSLGSATSPLFSGPMSIEAEAVQQPNMPLQRPSTGLNVQFDSISITADKIIVTPEPSSLALLGAGFVGLVAYGLWRRGVPRRRAKPTSFAQPQDDDLLILSFPSLPLDQANMIRRAA